MSKKVQTVCHTAFVFLTAGLNKMISWNGKLKIYKMLALRREVVYDMQ